MCRRWNPISHKRDISPTGERTGGTYYPDSHYRAAYAARRQIQPRQLARGAAPRTVLPQHEPSLLHLCNSIPTPLRHHTAPFSCTTIAAAGRRFWSEALSNSTGFVGLKSARRRLFNDILRQPAIATAGDSSRRSGVREVSQAGTPMLPATKPVQAVTSAGWPFPRHPQDPQTPLPAGTSLPSPVAP